MKIRPEKSYYEATARQRIEGIVDVGSFREFFPPVEKRTSPHLAPLRIPVQFDDGIIVGDAKIDGNPVVIAVQEGGFMGGALGEVHSAKMTGILKRALRVRPRAAILLLDSGGVRLQEANAGEIGAGEIIRAIFDLRAETIPVIGVVAGRCGCFGAAGIISGCCDLLIGCEEGRIGVSGPEVIETTMGVEAFDSRDRALVWRTTGGRNRRLFGILKEVTENTIPSLRQAIVANLDLAVPLNLKTLRATQKHLEERLKKFGNCKDAIDVWRTMGIPEPETVPDLTLDKFSQLCH